MSGQADRIRVINGDRCDGSGRAVPRWTPSARREQATDRPDCHPLRAVDQAAGRSHRSAAAASMRAHLLALHEGTRGKITIARKSAAGEWRQEATGLTELIDRIPSLAGQPDVYVSMNRFWGSRRTDRIATCSALYCDLDYYNSKHAHLMPEQARYLALEKLRVANKPPPTLTVSSGRGLTMVWLHSEIPPAALSRWNRCQESIFETLSELGADSCARDATRVFRLAGTVNSKSGREVRLLDIGDRTWNFDSLAYELLPRTRQELVAERKQRKVPQDAKRKKPVVRHTATSLWRNRLRELKLLAGLRWPQGIPPGHRDTWLFIASVALSWLVPPAALDQHIVALARHYCPAWSGSSTLSRMISVRSRAVDAANGGKREWKGKDVDPRYRLTSREIIRQLSITQEEMKQLELRMLVNPARRQELASERRRTARRRKGVLPRDRYEAAAAERSARAHLYREEGLSWAEVGRKLGLSADAARKCASRYREMEQPDRSVTVYGGEASADRSCPNIRLESRSDALLEVTTSSTIGRNAGPTITTVPSEFQWTTRGPQFLEAVFHERRRELKDPGQLRPVSK